MSQQKVYYSGFDYELFNKVNPIVGITVFPRGSVEVHRKNLTTGEHGRGARGKIKVFSKASRERLAIVAKETPVDLTSMMTLTYGQNYPHSGLKVKRHVKKFLRSMRKYFGGFQYLWFFEFQARGAPHLHVLSNLPPPTDLDRMIMSAVWVDDVQNLQHWKYCTLDKREVLDDRNVCLWVNAREKHWEGIRSKDGAARYCVKYAMKMHQKVAPDWFGDVGRFWGCSRYVRQIKGQRFKMADPDVRRILKETCPRLADSDVIPRYVYDCFT